MAFSFPKATFTSVKDECWAVRIPALHLKNVAGTLHPALFTLPALKKILPVFQDSTERMAHFFEDQLDQNGRVVIESTSG